MTFERARPTPEPDQTAAAGVSSSSAAIAPVQAPVAPSPPTAPASKDSITFTTPPISRPVPAWKRPFLALDERDFRNLWLGMLPGTMAMQMGMVTTGYVAYAISGSATAVGLVALGWGIPMLLLGLWGGVVADRFPKRRTLLLTQTLIGIAATINAVLVLTGVIEVWHLMLVAMLQGIGFAFNMPSRQAFIAQLVGRDRLMNAVALNNAGMNFSRVVGPSIAGALIGVPAIGAGGVFILMALMYAFVVFSLIRIPHRGEPVGTKRPAPLKSLGDGLSYVRQNPVVFTLLVLAFAPVLLGMPYQSLMPVFAEDVFDVGPTGLGILMTVNGIGALVGSLVIASMTSFRRRGLLQMFLGISFGVALAVFSFGRSFELGLATLLIVGLVSSGYQALNSTLVMNYTDQAYHGRVMSVYMLTFSAMPLGVVPFGALADAFGAPVTIGIAGIVLAIIVSLVGVLHPSYRHIQ